MKVRLLFAMVGLAITFALPTHAQQTNTPEPTFRERVISRFKAFTDALAKKDAAAVGANFTKDAIVVTPYGPVSGRQDIAYWYVDLTKDVQSTTMSLQLMRILLTVYIRLVVSYGRLENGIRHLKVRMTLSK
jgi:Domain of unknown function (DUF4440)